MPQFSEKNCITSDQVLLRLQHRLLLLRQQLHQCWQEGTQQALQTPRSTAFARCLHPQHPGAARRGAACGTYLLPLLSGNLSFVICITFVPKDHFFDVWRGMLRQKQMKERTSAYVLQVLPKDEVSIRN